MRALVQTKNGAPDVLKVKDWPEPQVGAGQVRIKAHACGLNFAEIQARIGFYPDAPKPPCVLGYELAGEIESLGTGVKGFQVGQRVMSGAKFGSFAELVVVKEADIVPLPDGVSYVEGAAIPVVYSTAYAAVIKFANLQPGEKILIHGAAGGVGIAATQLAKNIGAEIFGTSSAQKHEAMRAQGVQHAIDYRNQDVSEAVREITGGRGLDVILDPRGGKAFRESYKLLRAGGRLVMFGVNQVMSGERRNLWRGLKTIGRMPRFGAIKLMTDSKAAIGLNMLSLWEEYGSLSDFIEPIARMLESGAIKPVIAETFPLERAADAHRFIQERKNVGKVVLTL